MELAAKIKVRQPTLRGWTEGRRVSGLAMPYGKPAQMPWVRERVPPGTLTECLEVERRIRLDVQHDRNWAAVSIPKITRLESRAQDLWLEAELPETREADDCPANIRAEVYGGLSIEFRCQRNSWVDRERTVKKATLLAVSVVDSPQYPDAFVEARISALAACP